MTRRMAIAGFVTFLVLGIFAGSYGPSLTRIRVADDLNATTASLVLGTVSASCLLIVIVLGIAGSRTTLRLRLLPATLALVVGGTLYATATAWPLTLLGAGIIGLGFGTTGAGYNIAFATAPGGRRVGMVALINATYGVGAITGPLLIGLLPAPGYRIVFGLGAAVTVVPLVLLMDKASLPEQQPRASAAAAANTVDRRAGVVPLFMAMLFLSSAMEASVGAWSTTHLISIGTGVARANFGTASFWMAFTIGRFICAPVAMRAGERRLIVAALVGLIPSVSLGLAAPLAMLAYPLTGVLLASLFPCAMVWATRIAGNPDRTGVLVFASALTGSGVGPVVSGHIIDLTSPSSLPAVIAVMAGGCLLVAVVTSRAVRGDPPPLTAGDV